MRFAAVAVAEPPIKTSLAPGLEPLKVSTLVLIVTVSLAVGCPPKVSVPDAFTPAPVVPDVMTKFSPFQVHTAALPAPVSAEVTAVATPFRFVTPVRSMAVSVSATPSTVMLNPPLEIDCQSAIVWFDAERMPPGLSAADAVRNHRPIIIVLGCGLCPKYSSAASVSGAVVPKSSATAEMLVYVR